VLVGPVTLVHGSLRQPVWEYLLIPHRHQNFAFSKRLASSDTAIYQSSTTNGGIHSADLIVPETAAAEMTRAPSESGFRRLRDRDPRAYALSKPKAYLITTVLHDVASVQERRHTACSLHIHRLSGGW
jgi:hypothetical protein